MKSGIYLIYCTSTGKFYVGSAVYLFRRLAQHRYNLRNNKHKNSLLQRAWNKYWGECSFQFLIVEYCKKEETLIREQWWLDITHCWKREVGYNLNPIAGSNLGRKFGKPSLEHRIKIGNGNRGKIVSEETKLNMSIAQTGKTLSDEHRAKISKNKKGFKHTEEAKAKIAARKGWNHSEGTKIKISRKNKGSKRSEKSKLKMSLAKKGRKLSEETRARMRASHAKRLSQWYVKRTTEMLYDMDYLKRPKQIRFF